MTFISTILRTVGRQWLGVLAIFLVLSTGTAYALTGSNTVFSDYIVNGEVQNADVGSSAVASDEIKDGSVLNDFEDIALNALTSGAGA